MTAEFDYLKELRQLLIDSYKTISKQVEKPIYAKSDDDLMRDVMSTSFQINVGDTLQQLIKSTHNRDLYEKTIHRKLDMIPLFMKNAYLYYGLIYDEDFPLVETIPSVFKFFLMTKPFPDVNEIKATYMQLLNDYFIKDVCKEMPPFSLRTEMSLTDIEKNINQTLPQLKALLEKLLKLPLTKSTNTEVEQKTEYEAEQKTECEVKQKTERKEEKQQIDIVNDSNMIDTTLITDSESKIDESTTDLIVPENLASDMERFISEID